MNFKFTIILLICVFGYGYLSGQPQFVKSEKPDPKFAKWCIEYGNYYDALLEYQRLLKVDSSEVIYHYHVGLCHLKMNVDKSQAIPWLEWTVKQEKFDENAWYDLAEAYMVNGRLDEAITTFNKFQSLVKVDEHRIPATRMIEMCNNAKIAIKSPINVQIQNLGKYINSTEPDYNPYIPANESMLIFNSQRAENFGNYRNLDGMYPSDIYVTYFKFGKWKKVSKISSVINSSNIEEIIGYSPDGLYMFLYTEEIMGGAKSIKISEKKGKNYRPGETFINPEYNFNSISGISISPDKKFILFSAEKSGGIGGKDLYICRKLPNETWGVPELADSTLNTIYDENFPYFGPDGYLYFASTGFNSIGGYDLFKSKYDLKTMKFGKPQNLGFPVNTVMDDKTISISSTGRYAYISSLRPEGEGDLDIYRVIFKDAPPTYTIIKGTAYSLDSIPFTEVVKNRNQKIDSMNMPIYENYKRLLLKKDTLAANKVWSKRIKHEIIDVKITAIDKATNKTFGNYIAKDKTGNYVVILPPGDWKIIYHREGFYDVVIDNLSIEERDNRNKEIIQHIVFEPKT